MFNNSQKGATVTEYTILLATLFVVVISGLAFLESSIFQLVFNVDQESNLRNQENQAQTYVIENELQEDYLTWVSFQGLNELTSWDEYISANHAGPYDTWLSERSGFQTPPDGEILDLVVVPFGSGQAELTWTPTAPPNGRQVRGFHIYIDDIKIDTIPPVSTNIGESAISYIARDLIPNVSYRFNVRPYNNFGIGPRSNTISESISSSLDFSPSAPLNLVATPSSGEVMLTWDEPLDGNGTQTGTGQIVQYEITASPENFVIGDPVRIVPGGASSTSFTFDALTNEQAFTFSVKALNSIADGSILGEAATIVSQPLEPFDVSDLPEGIEQLSFRNNNSSNPLDYATESTIPSATWNISAPETQYYRIFYQGLWRKQAAGPVDYQINLNLNNNLLLQQQQGTFNSLQTQQDEYLTFETIVAVPAGQQSLSLSLQTESSAILQNVQTSLTPTFSYIKDVSPGEVLEIIPTSLTLSNLPEGVTVADFETGSNGFTTITPTQGNLLIGGTTLTVQTDEVRSYEFSYSGQWKSPSTSNIILRAYLDGNLIGVIDQQNLDTSLRTLSGSVTVPNLSAGLHNFEIRAQSTFGNSEYESTNENPRIIWLEDISGSNPLIRETQVDINSIGHGLKDSKTSTAGIAANTHSNTLIGTQSLTFSNDVPALSRKHRIDFELTAEGIEGDFLVIHAEINNGSPIRLIQDYFDTTGDEQRFTGSMIFEVPTGENVSTIDFFLSSGGEITVSGGTDNPINSRVIDLGN